MKIDNLELGDFPLLLAPMEDVSDPPFRSVCKLNGADLMYTEFISSEGLIRDAEKSVQKLDIYDSERPIGIQIFGDKIDSMRQAASIAEAAQPEILDINGLSSFLSQTLKLNVKIVNKDVILFKAIDNNSNYSESGIIDRKTGELVHEITKNIKSENSEKDITFYSCSKKENV